MTLKTKTSELKSWLLIDFKLVVICIFYYLFLHLLGQTCLIKWVIGFECPACGMTRAMKCLIKGDIIGYINFNFMALPTFIVLYLGFHKPKPLIKITNILTCFVAVGVLIRYIYIFT